MTKYRYMLDIMQDHHGLHGHVKDLYGDVSKVIILLNTNIVSHNIKFFIRRYRTVF